MVLRETPVGIAALVNFSCPGRQVAKDKKLLALAVIEDAAQFARLVDDEQLPTLKPLREVTVRRGVAGGTIESVL